MGWWSSPPWNGESAKDYILKSAYPAGSGSGRNIYIVYAMD